MLKLEKNPLEQNVLDNFELLPSKILILKEFKLTSIELEGLISSKKSKGNLPVSVVGAIENANPVIIKVGDNVPQKYVGTIPVYNNYMDAGFIVNVESDNFELDKVIEMFNEERETERKSGIKNSISSKYIIHYYYIIDFMFLLGVKYN